MRVQKSSIHKRINNCQLILAKDQVRLISNCITCAPVTSPHHILRTVEPRTGRFYKICDLRNEILNKIVKNLNIIIYQQNMKNESCEVVRCDSIQLLFFFLCT